jgi:benzoyl-CoA reductase subunit B
MPPPASEKQLESTRASSEYQKAWFASLRRDVFDAKKPYAIAQADMPLELFQLLGVPVVSNQWWSAVVSAKQLSGYFFDALGAAGYHEGLCRYCSLSLASSIAGDPSKAPWGGLPRPALLAARLTCDCIQRVFGTWASGLGADFIALDSPGATHLPPRWWELSRHRWRELYEPHRLDLMVAQMRVLIRKLEKVGRRKFTPQALVEWMEGVNRQEECFDEVRGLICSAPQTPVRMNEQVINVMNAQWHRGSEWAVGHARAFRDEIRSRVQRGIAAYPGEKLRLMWIGAGLWHDTEFYTAFEDSHGAVFVWSMYLAFGPDGYIRYGLDDPLRALASRIVSMNEQLHNPPWANEWIVEQARRHRIDAAVILIPQGSRPSATGSYFIEAGLESAGIPTLEIWADMVDSRRWDARAMRKRVAEFIDIRVPRRA